MSRAHPALAERRRAVARAEGRRRRSRVVTLLGAAAVLALAWWALTGPLVAVRGVNLVGYDRADRPELDLALRAAAESGSMLRVPVQALRGATQPFPWVGSVTVSRDWPAGVTVAVTPAEPVAALATPGGEAVLVSARGRVLGPAPTDHELAQVAIRAAPPAPGRPTPRAARGAVQLAAASPPEVRVRLRELRAGEGVLVGRLTDGPRLRLGGPERMVAKALALEAVLNQLSPADERRAAYIDLSVPERPAVGGIEAEAPDSEGEIPGDGTAPGDPQSIPEASIIE